MTQVKRLLSSSVEALLPTLAVGLALLIGAVMLLALRVNPLVAYGALIEGAVGNAFGITQTLIKATPLLLVGLGITIAFRGGVINIGGEGQLLVGALAATALALGLPTLPSALLVPLAMLAGALAGGLWGAIPGVLKARLGVNEILSTIMMNQIGIQLAYLLLRGPMIDPEVLAVGSQVPQSAQIGENAWLFRLIPRTPLHAGVVLALIMAVVVYVFLWRTVIGYRIRAVGMNPAAARYAGIRVPIYQALALTLAGALAGMAGAVEVQGLHHRVVEGLSGGYGFSGIVAALFGKLHPLGTIPASILFGGLLVGADKMQRAVQVTSALLQALNGLVVLFVVSIEIWSQYRARRRQIAAAPTPETDPSGSRSAEVPGPAVEAKS
jgi:simple sugar transport system permease protein